jgi:hypothetical protein
VLWNEHRKNGPTASSKIGRSFIQRVRGRHKDGRQLEVVVRECRWLHAIGWRPADEVGCGVKGRPYDGSTSRQLVANDDQGCPKFWIEYESIGDKNK